MDNVSRETFSPYIELLLKWNSKINLVGKSTVSDLFQRHIVDSLQIINYISIDSVITDFGSGAGFPGIVLALSGVREVHLVEKSVRKAEFLQEAAKLCRNKVVIHNKKIEELTPWKNDFITARALAPLDKLLDILFPFFTLSEKAFFLKGRKIYEELDVAKENFDIDYALCKSITADDSWIIEIQKITRKKAEIYGNLCDSKSKGRGRQNYDNS